MSVSSSLGAARIIMTRNRKNDSSSSRAILKVVLSDEALSACGRFIADKGLIICMSFLAGLGMVFGINTVPTKSLDTVSSVHECPVQE